MKRSDVFDNFVKIAQEKGLISESAEHTEKSLDNPRWDSLDISAIEALYGVKPDKPKDMEYEHNIMEDAHPNSVVISPSYDKLNGLVENHNERQNILLHIVNKTPDGLQTQRKYAEKDLLLSLVRIANDLDNKDQDELRALADYCLLQASDASQPLTKNAIAPLAVAGIAAVAALLGGIYLKNHWQFFSDGFERDHQKLVAEINDLVEANQSFQTEVGAGYTYKPEFIQEMQSFKDKLSHYFDVYKKVEPYIDQLEKPRTASELQDALKNPDIQQSIRAYKAFQSATDEILPYLQKIQQDFDSEGYKQRQIVEKGWAMKIVDPFLHGGKGLIADDFDDVYHAIKTYLGDIANLVKTLQSAKNIEKSLSKEMQEASYKSKEMFGQEEETKEAPFTPPTETAPKGTYVSTKPSSEVDSGADELEKQFKEMGFEGI